MNINLISLILSLWISIWILNVHEVLEGYFGVIFWSKSVKNYLGIVNLTYISSTWDIEVGELLWTQDKPGLLISSKNLSQKINKQ